MVVYKETGPEGFDINLKKGKKGETVTDRMLKLQYPDCKIIKWDYETKVGKMWEKLGVDYTVKFPTGFKLHIQTKRNLVLSKKLGNYASLELFKNKGYSAGRFIKGETAHRWYHINKHTNDAIYYDYPKQQNYIINHIMPKIRDKDLVEYHAYDGISHLFRMYYEDELFEGRYTYLKYNKDTGTWSVTKNQWKYVK